MINKLKDNWKVLLISALCALTITKCVAPMLKELVVYLTPEQELQITVIGAGEFGASEVWVCTESKDIDLSAIPGQSQVTGYCEYRLAEDYGYAFDFLVSHGNNLGTVLLIPYKPVAGTSLMFWCTTQGGVIKIQTKGFEETISLCNTDSDVGYLKTYELPCGTGSVYFYYLSLFAVFAVIFAAGCFLFKRKTIFSEQKPQGDLIERDSSIDLIRCVAAWLVLSVHSFLAAGYYNVVLEGGAMLVLTYLRWICFSLFLLLTGYLCKNRTLDRHPYRSLVSIGLTFFIITSLRILVVDMGINQTIPSLKEVAGHLLGMDLSWYFGMYVGLALLIPFLNMIWKTCNRHQREVLILVMLFICSAASITDQILPAFWEGIYPVAYYFIGAYLAEYPCAIKRRWLVVFFLLFVALETGYTFAAPTSAGTFNWALFGGTYQELQSISTIMASVTLFLILKSIKIRNETIKKILRIVSPCAFGIYIAEEIAKTFVYPIFQSKFQLMRDFLCVQGLYVLAVFLGSFAIAYPVNWLVGRIMNAATKQTKSEQSTQA